MNITNITTTTTTTTGPAATTTTTTGPAATTTTTTGKICLSENIGIIGNINRIAAQTTTLTTTTTTTTTIATTTTISCTGTGLCALLSVSGANGWTYYSKNYAATQSTPVLKFTAHGISASETVYLDDASVVDINLTYVQLLNNPSFEMSSSEPIGWMRWRTSSCAGSVGGMQSSTSECEPHSGRNCYTDHYQTGYDFLDQSFSATVGNIYTISFWYYKTGGNARKFYVDVK
ncbi:unnamed protein product [Rotaria magnacalcarata]|uniref:Uncharacterized protein n=1 Tax=Rotaria magnacalcarata TaxID=392030 RepID=A0A816LHB9_9BILA|nr:unnamed protein product [Rotaria magnacalcarata]